MDLQNTSGADDLHNQLLNTSLTKRNSESYIKGILQKDLPRSEKHSMENDLRWNFVLDKHLVWDKKPKLQKKRKLFLTRAERREMNLLKLPKNGWNHGDLEAMRQLWREYMRGNIDLLKAPGCEESSWSSLSFVLAKSEFIGAEITVIRSTVPSTIGITGTVVLETKSAFQVVTPNSELKVLLKKPSVFTFNLDNMLFTVFGKHMAIKPSERSVKKLKSQIMADL